MSKRLTTAVAALCAVISVEASAQSLTQVARFEHQVTGVTVSKTGRIFVNFPRWTDDAPVSVAEVLPDGKTAPYPNLEWNAWRNAKKDEMTAADHFVCVQSVVADGQGSVWALDAGAPAQGTIVPSASKLVRIDLATDKVVSVVSFGPDIAPQGSYLNDVRFSPDGHYAYITDSGAVGAIIVVDLRSGGARRLLDGHVSTQPEKDVVVKYDGKPLRRPDGRGVEFAADGIALSPDGSTLYWQAIKGKTLYKIATAVLQSRDALASAVADQVQVAGENGPADGLLVAKDGRMYVTSPEDDSVKVRDVQGYRTLIRDARLRWPDTLAEGPNGAIYVTASHIQDSAFFKPGAPASLPTELFRIDLNRAQQASNPR